MAKSTSRGLLGQRSRKPKSYYPVSTAALKKGLYHALVRADNTEPVSGKPMSALYYDVDLEVTQDVRGPGGGAPVSH